MNDEHKIRETVERLLPDAERFLCELIRFPSTPGQEQGAMERAFAEFSKIPGISAEMLPLSDAIKDDPDYSTPVAGIKYEGRHNLRLVRPGRGGGNRLLLNAHMDVVPPSAGMPDAWNPQRRQGAIFGRGACDDKGQVALLYLAMKALAELDLDLGGDLIGHVVVEEENGGNGSLAMARAGETADACIVLEPSEGRLYTSVRGAVWFRVTFTGKSGHSGQTGMTRSALLMARDAIAMLEKFHADLLASSRGIDLFDAHTNPMPITFGRLEAGNWPAAAPNNAVLEGVLGLLPNVTKEQVCEGMRKALATGGDEFFAANFDLEFMYRHDSSVVDPQHPFPQVFLKSAADAGIAAEIDAMTASCDAWFYNNQLRIPTVVFGAGSLKVAHSKDENLALSDLSAAAEVLVTFIRNYCGQARSTL